MLLWQLKNVRNRHLLWLKLLTCSLAVHLMFVGVAFFGYRDGVSSHKFTMHSHNLNTQIAVVIIPTMCKTNTPNTGTKQPAKTHTTHRAIKPSNQKKAATQMTQPKPVQKKAVLAKTTPAKAAPKKIVPAKAVPAKAAPVKPAPVKTVPVKKAPAPIENPAQKEKNQPEVTPKPIEKIIDSPKQESASQKTVEKAPVIENNVEQNGTQGMENETTHIEISYSQAREFYQQEALRKELSKHWQPPHGMPDTCTCEITTYVGNNGVVTDSVITESSGILMYDVSARAAILAMELPRWTWGASFPITFINDRP